jgi:hypothetical protein
MVGTDLSIRNIGNAVEMTVIFIIMLGLIAIIEHQQIREKNEVKDD